MAFSSRRDAETQRVKAYPPTSGFWMHVSDVNTVTGIIVDAAIRIHRDIGPGLLETVYETVLARDLTRRGLNVERQKHVSFVFDGLEFDDVCRVDLLVEHAVVVEIKSLSTVLPQHHKQLMTYIRLLDCRVGLLLNFGAAYMKDGIHRIANRF